MNVAIGRFVDVYFGRIWTKKKKKKAIENKYT